MFIRIFGDKSLEAAVAFLHRSDKSNGFVFVASSEQWLGKDSEKKADVHLYVGAPMRLALPFARYNVGWASTAVSPWVADDYDEPVATLPTTLRERVNALRGVLDRARRRAPGGPEVPEAPLPDIPMVGIVTLTTAARTPVWKHNMLLNIQAQNYPSDKLQWLVVTDGDAVATGLPVVPSPPEESIGAKRNRGCAAAWAAGCDVVVMMDDDDQYPADSVTKRVAALRASAGGIVCCSTIPTYDAVQYVSTLNVPALTEPAESRCSEASLAFTRAAWLTQRFPDTSVSEGIGFLAGRVSAATEICPLGVIVGIIHGRNATQRRYMKHEKPNGCHWGFDDNYFKMITAIAHPGA